ncbi:MAG: MraY family glycosyltransferase [Candidatus Gracilibacteria bacterium]|jgi:UDP-GlcNAc:undecaprenyl-phosphate GlcNAc-1-phosphate transferase
MSFSIFITAFGFTAAFAWGALRLFPRLGLMDRPERYGHKRSPIPYPGGVASFFAFLATVALAFPGVGGNAVLVSVLAGASLLAFTCFLDDRFGLSPYLRLLIQVLVAFCVVAGGVGISSITNPFGDPLVLDGLNIPFHFGNLAFTLTVFADILTVAWVVTMVNAFNWIDGVPGMANASAATASFILLLLSMRPDFHFVDQTLSIALSATILGLSLGFLIFDFPKPKMLMGDTGSMLLGFLLAVTAIISGGKIATTILVLGFPILDFVWVILRRLFKGQSPFKGDLGHFHHRLLRAGFSDRQVVILFALTGGLFGGISLLLHTEGKLIALALLAGGMLVLLTLLYAKKE